MELGSIISTLLTEKTASSSVDVAAVVGGGDGDGDALVVARVSGVGFLGLRPRFRLVSPIAVFWFWRVSAFCDGRI